MTFKTYCFISFHPGHDFIQWTEISLSNLYNLKTVCLPIFRMDNIGYIKINIWWFMCQWWRYLYRLVITCWIPIFILKDRLSLIQLLIYLKLFKALFKSIQMFKIVGTMTTMCKNNQLFKSYFLMHFKLHFDMLSQCFFHLLHVPKLSIVKPPTKWLPLNQYDQFPYYTTI